MNNLNSNDPYMNIIAQAIEEMKSQQGKHFSLETINLTELERSVNDTINMHKNYQIKMYKKGGTILVLHSGGGISVDKYCDAGRHKN